MNYILIIIIVLIIAFWFLNDLLTFFEYFNSGICVTPKWEYGNYYGDTCHPFTSSTAPSNKAIYTASANGSGAGTWSNVGTTATDNPPAGGGSSGTGGSSSTPLGATTKDTCINKADIGKICSARNGGAYNYGIKTMTPCSGNDEGKVRVECELNNFNSIQYENIISATPCLDKSINFNEACRIYQPTDRDLRSQGYNINSIGSKKILYDKFGDCYNSNGNPDYNKARGLCSYNYLSDVSKITPALNNLDYNEYTNCKPMNSEFQEECKNILGIDKDKIFAYIDGYDCLPGYGRAKCIKKKKLEISKSEQQFLANARNEFY
jgi:hypothetical protein